MTKGEVKNRTRKYIKENFLYTTPGVALDDDADLLETGVIDSMGVMELLDFIREAFGVEIEDDDITEENLGTVSAIGSYVVAKLSHTSSEPTSSRA